MPLGKSEYNCLWIKSGYMMTILSQQFFLHNRYSKYQQMVCEGIIEPEELPSIELLHGFMGCEFIFKLFSGRSLMNSLTWIQEHGVGNLWIKCDMLHDLVPSIQFYKREKHPWRSVSKVTLLHGWFARFSNCTDRTKSRNASHILPSIPTNKKVAPPNILHVIQRKCQPSMKNPYGTNICSCGKNGLECMPACGACHGEDCNNQHISFLN